MKKIYSILISIFLLASSNQIAAQSFSWANYVRNATSYTNTNSGITLSVSVTGTRIEPGYPSYGSASGGFLNLGADWANKTSSIKVTVSFSKALTGVSFLLYDVDENTNWDDKITIDGTGHTGAAVYPVLSGNSYTVISGTNNNIIEGKNDNPTFLNNPAKVDFGTKPVKTFTVTYSAGSNSPSNPAFQVMAIGTITYNNVLPLDLVSFKAVKRNNDADLSWKAENMVSFSHFEVECSEDAGNSFQTIGTVSINAGTNGSYSFTDINVQRRMSKAFYRLKMVDIDGDFKYSGVVMVSFEGMIVSVWPTLVKTGETVTVNIAGGSAARCDVRLFDMSGKLLMQKNQVSGQVKLTTGSFNKGIYIIQVSDGVTAASYRICLQ